ncbi:hypothetical protein PCANC_25284 [Puccinia coronata f. sp. avenae]|uniref:Uncharacterized protein n=1 Tax=Puccinia coronata f. sp. avenae TaxID=200324 RepID=A0A2N5U558_9BASI|nr:hypothetical protein PCANC_25284 [Puccinia coronata f. sp. avenae]
MTKHARVLTNCITLPMSLTEMDDHHLEQHITASLVAFYHGQPKGLQVEAVASLICGKYCFVQVGTSCQEHAGERSGSFHVANIHFDPLTAGINRSNTAARAVLEQPCSTGGRTDTVRPKREPTGRTDLSDRSRLVLCNRSQELIGQACLTRRQMLRSDSACPTTGRTRLFEHRSNCRVRPVNAGSV